MKTIEIKAYEFSELQDEAKEKARAWYRRANDGDTFWSECTIDEAVEQAALMGITIKKSARGHHVFFSGFSSQGDGACFEGTWSASECNPEKAAEGWGECDSTAELKRIAAEFGGIAKSFPASSFSVKHRGHYSHENCTEFDFDSGADDCDPDELERYRTAEDDPEDPDSMPRDRMAQDFPEDPLKEAARDFMRWIYRQLEKEWEFCNSDEQVDENIEANEFYFTADGSRRACL